MQSFDIDNRLKTLIDALAGAGVIGDDKHIDAIIVRRGSLDPPHGSVTVRIDEIRCVAITLSLLDEWFVGNATAAA